MKDSNKLTIKFVSKGLDIKVQATETTSFIELLKKFYETCKLDFEENKTNIFFELGSTNKQINWNTKTSLKELGLKNYGFIIVIDPKELVVSKVGRGEIRYGTKVIEENSEKDFPESFPEILGDMALFSEECLSEAIEKKTNERDYYISYEDALKKKENRHSFLFGLIGKYLKENFDANVYINLNENIVYDTKNKLKGIKTLRYLSNGFITKTKSTITLIINNPKDLIQDKIRKEINDGFKLKLFQEFRQLKDNNFTITNITDNEQFKFLLIPVKNGEFELNQNFVQNFVNYSGNFNKNKETEIEEEIPLMQTFILNRSFLYSQQDSNDNSKYGYNEKRGGEKYYPPVGWWRFGVLAYDYYGSDNDWLKYNDNSWCVAYIGLRKLEIEEKVKEFENDEDERNPGHKVGLGVAVCQKPEDMEEDCEVIEYENVGYKIGFMLRIKPEAIRIPKSGKGKYWVVSGTKDDLRPYGILSKKLKQ